MQYMHHWLRGIKALASNCVNSMQLVLFPATEKLRGG